MVFLKGIQQKLDENNKLIDTANNENNIYKIKNKLQLNDNSVNSAFCKNNQMSLKDK